jgi:acyl carrier protein
VSRRPIEPTLKSDLIGDLGFDSLQVLELVAELEDRLNTSIPTDDLTGIRTVEHVVAHVTSLVQPHS